MKILYVNSRIYDFLTATIIEGLNALSSEKRIDLIATTWSNYARSSQIRSRREIYQARRSFDLAILGTNEGVDVELFWDVARPGHSICIDGSDNPQFTYPPSEFTLYFKRELYNMSHDNIRACPFAIERRWFSQLSNRLRYFLAACFGPSTDERARTLEYLKSLSWPNIKFGEVPMNKLASLSGIILGQCSFLVWQRSRFAVGHNYKYYRILRSSLLALGLPGLGIDTGRYWEILGSGALLIFPATGLQIPNPLLPDEHFLEYASFDDLHEKLQWAKVERKRINNMRQRAREHCSRHHTTRQRARYVIDEFTL
jgi:Glycosyl transferases group 1